MKIYKVMLLIVNHDEMDGEEIRDVIENTYYPNRCINPEVIEIKEAEVNEDEWNKDKFMELEWAKEK